MHGGSFCHLSLYTSNIGRLGLIGDVPMWLIRKSQINKQGSTSLAFIDFKNNKIDL